MKKLQKFVSAMLCFAMACSLFAVEPPAKAAAAEASYPIKQQTGSIGVTVCFDFPQTKESVAAQDLKLTLSKGGAQAVVALNDGTLSENTLGLTAAQVFIRRKNTEGAELTSERRIGYLEANLSGLALGDYTVLLTGKGYKKFSQTVSLGGYSQHIIVSTAGGAFAIGDVNGNGSVDETDRSLLAANLGLKNELAAYDLNNDGEIDIVDLLYLNRSMQLSPKTELMETAAIAEMTIATNGLTVDGSASDFRALENLFADNDTAVRISSDDPDSISIPIELNRSVEMSQIDIATPTVSGGVLAGTVTVELADGSTESIPFDYSTPADVHAIGRTAGQNVISIPLGKKVAVKKVTITVTKVEGQNGANPEFAVLTQIEFLKDIVPDAPQADATQVKGVQAVPGDGSVTLSWNPVRNVTGYTVAYGDSPNALKQTVSTKSANAVVSGLKNTTTYYFQVTATNGSWKGTPSEVISAVPQAGNVPGAPSNIRVEPADRALRISWGSTKDATMYQVYYRTAGETAFSAFGGSLTGTSAVITGLTNGTTYEVAVKAGNGKGFGPYSATAAGTPEPEQLVLPDLPANGRIDSSKIASIVMADKNNVNTSLCPNFTVDDLIDNSASTYWIAKNWSLDSTITFTFKEAQDMNYLLLVPYLDKAYSNRIDTYTVTAKDSAGKTILETGTLSAPALTERNYLVLAFPETKGIQSLSVSLGEKTGGPRVSISEIAFYESDSLPDEIAALFTDNSFTALKSGVTLEQIGLLRERLDAMADFYMDTDKLRDELTLAESLANGNTDALGLVQSGFQSRSGAKDSQYGQSASDLQPVGISALAGSSVSVYAELPEDSPVFLVPTQYFGESGIWRGAAVQLKSGRNYITTPKIGSLTDPRGGMYYLTYAGENPEAITLHIRDSEGVFRIPVLELSNWYNMQETERTAAIQKYVDELTAYCGTLSGSLPTSVQNATEISTPSVLLSLPADCVLNGLKSGSNAAATMYQNILAWEEVLFVANKTQGIIDADTALADYRYPMSTRQNIRYMRMFAGAFMYAAGNHVGIGYGSASALVQGRPTSDPSSMLFGWGIAHEIGHNMDKLGKAEITNNIYSLAVQAWDGSSMQKQTRLAGFWDKIYDKTAAQRVGAANNVFVQLGMYWQLHLAYDNANSPLAFYNEFFRLWKAGEYAAYSYDERVALIASKVADHDLTEFFTRWGMELGEGAKGILGAYPEESRAIWYLNDDSYISRLNGRGTNSGASTISASVSGNVATITLTNDDPGTILGYEIKRNGTPIGFTRTGSYQDDLGEANNLTYEYSAIPIDLLGNMGAEVTANEVRVAYDKTIDDTLYNISAEGDVITITMKGNAVPVTGILSDAGSASCTVRIKADPQSEWTTAFNGAVTASTPAYFQKPGAEAGDTRLWTFDAAIIEISGLSDTNIRLLDYPGDRIDFHESATVGYLKNAYRYGDDADDVIPQGTLVILGTYRGDPVYNTVEIQARYHKTEDAAETAPEEITRPMNGYAVMFAEIPKDGAVSDTSDGFFLFVPDLQAEKRLNEASGIINPIPSDASEDLLIETENNFPAEIQAVLYRTDRPEDSSSRRMVSQTLWIGFPSEDTFPQVALTTTP